MCGEEKESCMGQGEGFTQFQGIFYIPYHLFIFILGHFSISVLCVFFLIKTLEVLVCF